jgi:predicted HicB family RNase H-like nuclease
MPRTASIGIRVEPTLKEAVERAAKTDGRTVAQWIERLLIREVQTAPAKPARKKAVR